MILKVGLMTGFMKRWKTYKISIKLREASAEMLGLF